MNEWTAENFRLVLSFAVPLRIAELLSSGGASSEDFARIRPYAGDLGSYGDQLIFGGPRRLDLLIKLIDAIAVLSFVPGGISLFGAHFEAPKRSPATRLNFPKEVQDVH